MNSNEVLLEWGDPQNDPRAFRRTLGHYGTGVAVITAQGEAHPVGVTVNSFASVSLDPPLVLWSLVNEGPSRKGFLTAGRFVINVLGSHQRKISNQFATTSDDKFEGVVACLASALHSTAQAQSD